MTVYNGAYSATWNNLPIGNLELGGIREKWGYDGRKISFDAVGTAPVDQIFTGLNMLVLDFVCMEYDAAAISTMMWPWHAIRGNTPAAGASMWAKAKTFVMTSCRSDINPLTKTFMKTILAPGFEVQLDYSGIKERTVPIRLLVFPVKYNASGYGGGVGSPTETLMPTGCSDQAWFTETLMP